MTSGLVYGPELYLLGRSCWVFAQLNLERKLGGLSSTPVAHQYGLGHAHNHVGVLGETCVLLLVLEVWQYALGLGTTQLVDLYTGLVSHFFLFKAGLVGLHAGLFQLYLGTHLGRSAQRFSAGVIHIWTVVTATLMLLVGSVHLTGLFVLLELYTVGMALLFSGLPGGAMDRLQDGRVSLTLVVQYLLTNLHVTLYLLVFVYLVYQQTGSFALMYWLLAIKHALLFTALSGSFLYVGYGVLLFYLFFKLAMFPFLSLYTRVLSGISKEVLVYYTTVPKLVLFALAKKLFFLFFGVHQGPTWGTFAMMGIALGTVIGPSIQIMQTLHIQLFFIYSSFSTTGFVGINFLLPSGAHVITTTYLYLYMVGSVTLFAIGYVADAGSTGQGFHRGDQGAETGLGTRQAQSVVAALLLSLGAFSPFGSFLVKYMFLFGWVSNTGHYGLLWVVLLASAINSVAYFYVFYLVVIAMLRTPENMMPGGVLFRMEAGGRVVQGASGVSLAILVGAPLGLGLELGSVGA